MEEVMTMMMINSTSHNDPMNESLTPSKPITTTSISPTWKLYHNPFYQNRPLRIQTQHHQHCQTNKHFHQLNLLNPASSARKIAASFWDLTFFRPAVMEVELERARTQVAEMRAELEYEQKARRKAEALNRRLAKEVTELERMCGEIAREVSLGKAEINRMKKGIEEERKMLRMAEVLREERVQMKLADAKILMEEKLSELQENSASKSEFLMRKHRSPQLSKGPKAASDSSGVFSRMVSSEISCDDCNNNNNNIGANSGESIRSVLSEKPSFCGNISIVSSSGIHRKSSPEPENPHIKRGIKGFVEFPRVVRTIGTKSRHWGTKLECQKAQLRILLKQKCPIRSNSLIMS